jgi:uncharacterized membrane protein
MFIQSTLHIRKFVMLNKCLLCFLVTLASQILGVSRSNMVFCCAAAQTRAAPQFQPKSLSYVSVLTIPAFEKHLKHCCLFCHLHTYLLYLSLYSFLGHARTKTKASCCKCLYSTKVKKDDAQMREIERRTD